MTLVVSSRSSSALPVAPSTEIRSLRRPNFGKTNFVSPFALHLKFVSYLLCELLCRVLVSYIPSCRVLYFYTSSYKLCVGFGEAGEQKQLGAVCSCISDVSELIPDASGICELSRIFLYAI